MSGVRVFGCSGARVFRRAVPSKQIGVPRPGP